MARRWPVAIAAWESGLTLDRSLRTCGKPETWGKFGEGENDAAADLERRQLAMHSPRWAAQTARVSRMTLRWRTWDGRFLGWLLHGCFMAAAGGPIARRRLRR